MRKLSNHNNSEINKKTLFHTHTKIKYIDLYTNLPKKKKKVGMSYHLFGKIILVIFDHSKWFENSLENGLKNNLENGLTLQISRWYKWLRFKDIV